MRDTVNTPLWAHQRARPEVKLKFSTYRNSVDRRRRCDRTVITVLLQYYYNVLTSHPSLPAKNDLFIQIWIEHTCEIMWNLCVQSIFFKHSKNSFHIFMLLRSTICLPHVRYVKLSAVIHLVFKVRLCVWGMHWLKWKMSINKQCPVGDPISAKMCHV